MDFRIHGLRSNHSLDSGSLMNWMLREGANEQFVGSRGVSLVKKVSELDLIVADNHYWTMIGSSI